MLGSPRVPHRKKILFSMASVLCIATLAVCILPTRAQEEQGGPSPAAAGPALLSIPIPSLSHMNKDVRNQLRDSQAALEALQEQRDVSAEELGLAFGKLGKLYHAYKFLEAAEACYRNAQTLRPDVFEWPYYLGHVYDRQGTPLEAIATFDDALAIQPDSLPAMIALAQIHLSAEQLDQAEPLFRRALTQDRACVTALVGLGKIALARRDFAVAVRHFESALARQPEASVIYYPLAMAYRGLGEMDKARKLLQKGRTTATAAEVADPLMDELQELCVGYEQLILTGVAMGQAGKLDGALERLEQAVLADPQNPDARMNLGTVLAKLGRSDTAIEQFRSAIRLKPDYILARCNLGALLSIEGRNKEAIKHFGQAIRYDSECSHAHLGLADALVEIGDHELASTHYAHVIRIDPRHPSARLGQVVALSRMGRYADALERLQAGLAVLPQSMGLTHAMARLLAACPDQTVRDGPRALRLGMTVFKIKQTIEHGETVAMAYAEGGQYEQACRLQSQIVAVAQKAKGDDIPPRLRRNLTLYRANKPCRNPWPSKSPRKVEE
jgi:tetratricopeptide (TPR) repeat protein